MPIAIGYLFLRYATKALPNTITMSVKIIMNANIIVYIIEKNLNMK